MYKVVPVLFSNSPLPLPTIEAQNAMFHVTKQHMLAIPVWIAHHTAQTKTSNKIRVCNKAPINSLPCTTPPVVKHTNTPFSTSESNGIFSAVPCWLPAVAAWRTPSYVQPTREECVRIFHQHGETERALLSHRAA